MTPLDWSPIRVIVGSHSHPANGMTARVDVGDGAIHTILNPQSFEDGGLAWALTWWDDVTQIKHVAAGVIESFDYLLCEAINMKEATRRLRMLRKARKQFAGKAKP